MNTMARAARHVGETAGAAEQTLQRQVYRNRDSRSRVSLLEQAGEVLCLLALFPLSATTRVGFTALFERRLRRAYAGGG
jgi:hypothetical protein